jgi:capsular polysaccharide export protein
VLELFAAAYMLYPRYVDPFTGARSCLEETMERIAFLKQEYAKRPHQVHCFGVPRWKRGHVRPFLSRPGGRVSFYASQQKSFRKAAEEGGEIVVWAAKENSRLQTEADAAGLSLSRLEDGFIRSCGLGSDLIAASSLVLDRTGVHFNHTRPSDIESILNETDFSQSQLERARWVREFIQKHGISKYNSEFQPFDPKSWPVDRTRILVPGQVDDDAAVQQGTERVRSNRELLETVRQENPEAFVVYKIHPDVASGNRTSSLSRHKAEELADAVITGVPLNELFPRVDEVHVLTSLAGFEALMAGKEVVIYGGPFYAGWGLTRDRLSFPRRTRSLSLNELLAGSLLSYPMYHDWQTGLPCTLETTLERLTAQRSRLHRKTGAFAIKQTGKGWHWVSRIINGTAGLAGVVRR